MKRISPTLRLSLQQHFYTWAKENTMSGGDVMSITSADAAAVLGSISTPTKAAASRANGKRGGRPTNQERAALADRAAQLVSLDSDGVNVGTEAQVETLIAEMGVSRNRARTAVAQAARRARWGDAPKETS